MAAVAAEPAGADDRRGEPRRGGAVCARRASEEEAHHGVSVLQGLRPGTLRPVRHSLSSEDCTDYIPNVCNQVIHIPLI